MPKPEMTQAQPVQPNGSAPSRRSSEVSSVRKALELLGSFSPQRTSWPLSELARRLQIPKSTAHILLRTLQSLDFVRQNHETRTYQLGPRGMELGLVFGSNSDMLSRARTAIEPTIDPWHPRPHLPSTRRRPLRPFRRTRAGSRRLAASPRAVPPATSSHARRRRSSARDDRPPP